MARRKAHHSRVTEKDVTGIGVPREAAMSRTAFALRLFCRLGASSFGRPGGRGRKARRSFPGTPTPVRSAHPIGVGLAVQQPQLEATIMRTSAPTGAPCAVVIPFPYSSPSLTATRIASLTTAASLVLAGDSLGDPRRAEAVAHDLIDVATLLAAELASAVDGIEFPTLKGL